MAVFNLDYYRGEDLYSDGDAIENEILAIAESGKTVEELDKVSFPVLYHLSRIRENILNWYPFKAQACGLEIGSGCGAITGLLCERLQRVISCELSGRRAKINYTRHQAYENLEVCVGNLNDMVFDTQFDYVIVNGVFEYAMSFTDGEKPYETFLNNISRFLKPDGIVLVAIENRLGLKYFAGAPEDHTDKYFDGLDAYEGNHSVRTFSKAEWMELMNACDFTDYRFYYPYPDYKFPKEIFTDSSLKEQSYGRPVWSFTDGRMQLFSEEKISAAFQKEQIMDRFANSFLIEMSKAQLPKEEVLYAKLSTDRDAKYAIATVIEKNETGKVVTKKAMTRQSCTHIRQMAQMEQQMLQMSLAGKTWHPLAGKLKDDEKETALCYPYLVSKSLGTQAQRAVIEKDVLMLQRLLAQVRGLCESGEQKNSDQLTEEEKNAFAMVFGSEPIPENSNCVCPANIDLILDNIFLEQDVSTVIDCEWMFQFPVPVDFIIWRAANELYSTYPEMEAVCEKQEFYQSIGIGPEHETLYWNWATNFTERYVGANQLLNRSVPVQKVSLEEIRLQRQNAGNLKASLYVDQGSGFSEEEKLECDVQLQNGHFEMKFDLSGYSQVKALRFDPLEGSCCRCHIEKAATNVKLTAMNAAGTLDEDELFLTKDPIYLIKGMKETREICIRGTLQVLSMERALELADQLLQKGIGNRWKKLF